MRNYHYYTVIYSNCYPHLDCYNSNADPQKRIILRFLIIIIVLRAIFIHLLLSISWFSILVGKHFLPFLKNKTVKAIHLTFTADHFLETQ